MTRNDQRCANCGHEAPLAFCPACGQATRCPRRSVATIFADFLDNYIFTWNSKLTRTVGTLLARPGRLTADYLSGKRISQLPPLRTYLVLALLTFFFSSPINLRQPRDFNLFIDNKPHGPQVEGRAPFSITTPDPQAIPYRWFPNVTRRTTQRLYAVTDGRFMSEMITERVNWILPNLVLCLIPLVALLLSLCFRIQGRPLYDFFIFSIHLHSGILALILIGNFADRLNPFSTASWFVTGAVFAIPLTTFIALRRVFAHSWIRTASAWCLMMALYYAFASQLKWMSVVVTYLTL